MRARASLGPVPELTDPFAIGGVAIPNRVVLAPLAGIGNWFVRLQAKRHGAGLAVSEMVSSFGDPPRQREDAHRAAAHPPATSAAAGRSRSSSSARTRTSCAPPPRTVAERGADLIDLNMGCPVPKVCKTGAGAALHQRPRHGRRGRARGRARAAACR